MEGRKPYPLKGTLYIVATPIGNLEDITLRALRVLKEVDVIAVEDTRHSLKLLSHYEIKGKPLISYWAEREKVKSEEVMKRLNLGQSVALISDSGTPAISDPGGVLVRKALDSGILVVPVPGPSALIAALSVSGMPVGGFTFIGFLPSKRTQRVKALKDLSLEKRTLVFYEAPHRLLETLADIEEIFGSRMAVVIKEITKLHEEAMHGSIPELRASIQEKTIAGEYVIIVEGRKIKEVSFGEALSEVMALIKKGMGRKEAVKTVAREYGISKNELYEKSLLR
ncbi:MAG: 16S rRNA (cytidine(1402)-2'-O)-methyltransferase [Nitrospirae bacterium]|nr:16S rRNA (cytidine(1402)-2'-O)-methyltransferase [Nitrospirota bacterium]